MAKEVFAPDRSKILMLHFPKNVFKTRLSKKFQNGFLSGNWLLKVCFSGVIWNNEIDNVTTVSCITSQSSR